MLVALWHTQPVDLIAAGFAQAAPGIQVVRESPAACLHLLEQGEVQVALIPTLAALQHPNRFDVIPGIALSTWDYPLARLYLKRDLNTPIRTLALDPTYAQEAFTAQLILKEHYGAQPEVVSYEGRTDQLASAAEDAVLCVGTQPDQVPQAAVVMDLGQEWYELVNYPMVWGVFATWKDAATPPLIRTIMAGMKGADTQRAVWLQAQEMTPAWHTFFREDLRLRMDDHAVASLTELREYLYYNNVTPEVADLPVVALDDEDADDDETLLL